jgi:uncharacterized protein with beta-barrel porin domain
VTIRPFDSFDYITQQEQSFKEHGGGLTDLSVLGKTLRMVRNDLGLNFAKCFSIGRSAPVSASVPTDSEMSPNTTEINPNATESPNIAEINPNVPEWEKTTSDKLIIDLKLSWVREVRLKGKSVTSRFIGTGVHFTTEGYFVSRSLFSPGLSLTYITLDDLLDVMVYYNGEFGSKYRDNSVGLEVGFQF